MADMTSPEVPEADSADLKAQVFKRLHPRTYLEKFLSSDFRPDGRELREWRDTSLNVGSISTASGSSLTKIGQTIVVTGVKLEIAEPSLDRPSDGWIVPNIDLGALCHPKFKPGPPGEAAQVLGERVYDTLLSSGLLDLAKLCIQPGKSAWVLYVDATCLNYDGNVFDAFLSGACAALANVQLPKATFNQDTGETICSPTESTPLKSLFSHNLALPYPEQGLGIGMVALSFGIFASKILSDPTSFEEPLLDATVSVVLSLVDPALPILSVESFGALPSSISSGSGMDVDQGQKDAMKECIALARERAGVLKGYFAELGL